MRAGTPGRARCGPWGRTTPGSCCAWWRVWRR